MNVTRQYRNYIQQLGRVICPPPFLSSVSPSFFSFPFLASLLSALLLPSSSLDIIGRVFLYYLSALFPYSVSVLPFFSFQNSPPLLVLCLAQLTTSMTPTVSYCPMTA